MSSYNLQEVVEVRELYDVDLANNLLSDGWKLLELKTDRVSRTTVERTNYEWGLLNLGILTGEKDAPITQEELKTKYILGRYKTSG